MKLFSVKRQFDLRIQEMIRIFASYFFQKREMLANDSHS